MRILFISILFIVSFSCVSQKKITESEKDLKYQEDLSLVRPLYANNLDTIFNTKTTAQKPETFNPKHSITEPLKTVEDSMIHLNKKIQFVRGYKVLVYSAESQEAALEMRKKIIALFESLDTYQDEKIDMQWHSPTYRIKVGEYLNRLDAVRMKELLKSAKLSSSPPIVVPDLIQIH